MKKCVILEMENNNDFENAMDDYLDAGYKIVFWNDWMPVCYKRFWWINNN